MKPAQSYFPVQAESRALAPRNDGSQVIENQSHGGITVREEIAVRVLCALVSNPAIITHRVPSEELANSAIRTADAMIGKLSEGELDSGAH